VIQPWQPGRLAELIKVGYDPTSGGVVGASCDLGGQWSLQCKYQRGIKQLLLAV